ncbi:hypothetical protein ANO14919_084950 [Xylariales sp. No.14919]|nr:hypothetical protein ANO14919_084950 [Xylariales sp. No.14919]
MPNTISEFCVTRVDHQDAMAKKLDTTDSTLRQQLDFVILPDGSPQNIQDINAKSLNAISPFTSA